MFDKMFSKKAPVQDNSVVKKQDGPILTQVEMDKMSNELITKLKLEIGTKVYLFKKAFNDLKGVMESTVMTGEEMGGDLTAPVKLGESIDFNDFETGKPGNTSNINRVYEDNGKYFVKTRTSVYELKLQEQIDQISNELIKKYGLDVTGKDVILMKRLISQSAESDIQVGTQLFGKLVRPVALGQSIDLNSGGTRSNTNAVERVYEDNNYPLKKRLIKTATSVYEIKKS